MVCNTNRGIELKKKNTNQNPLSNRSSEKGREGNEDVG